MGVKVWGPKAHQCVNSISKSLDQLQTLIKFEVDRSRDQQFYKYIFSV
jgi:hypothetical protein